MLTESRLRELERRMAQRGERGLFGITLLNNRERKDIHAAIRELLMKNYMPASEKHMRTRVSSALERAGMTLEEAKAKSEAELVATVDGLGRKGARYLRQM